MQNLQEIREQIVEVCRLMWQKGWVAANDGNVSVKLDDGTFLTTPTGMSKYFIKPEMLCHIDKDGNMLEENGQRPSSELKMHLRCYEEREDVRAVVHAHPPCATAYAVANKALDNYCMIETIVSMGSVPVTPFGTPSTYEVPDAIAPYLAYHDVVLLKNHGALTMANSLIGAYYKMETLELFAQISLNAEILGGAQELPKEKIDTLIDLRSYYKVAGKHPGYKKYPEGDK